MAQHIVFMEMGVNFVKYYFFQTACHRQVEGRLAYSFSLVDGFLFCEAVKHCPFPIN